MAKHAGVSASTVQRIWSKNNLKPLIHERVARHFDLAAATNSPGASASSCSNSSAQHVPERAAGIRN
jgi:hypothetical protein